MSEESDTTDQESKPALDDPRFEVKWQKKAQPPPPPPSAPEEQTAAPPSGEDAESLRRQLADAETRIRELQDKWQRAAADLVNLRRRTEQEREEVERFASMLLVAELLPVLDNFERALATIPGNLSMLTWVQGVMLIDRHIRALLEHQGLAAVEAEGQKFNPSLHEAIAERETDDVESGSVLQVYQKGYTMHGRVIRPALVELAKATEKESAAGTQPAQDAGDTDQRTEQAATEDSGP